ncbi:MAG: hypothetical protein HQL64_05580 [Magnetococcales bacterium]|nr:hypothetical protein [Magnetococcales bacterium]
MSLLSGSGLGNAAPPIQIRVVSLPSAPVVDGSLGEWGKEGWSSVPLHPAKEGDGDNFTGVLTVELKAGVFGERIYLAARWPDPAADMEYRPWKWIGSQYKRSKQRDDMLAVRFDMGGDYADCMFSKTDYKVDLWQWSAGRSDKVGLAEDFTQIISTSMQESAAEYEIPGGGTVYIRKVRDSGDPLYENTEAPAEKQSDTLPGIKVLNGGSGSLVDVSAKGVWKDGFWSLELSRKLDTSHDDDVKLTGIKEIRGAVAVFNNGYAEHKSVSDTLMFVF